MAIVSMTKFTLFTYRSDRERVLSLLQKFNDVHFAKQTIQEDFRIENHQKELTALSKDIQNLARVISLLKEETGQGDKEVLMRQMSYEELIRKGFSTDLTRLREKVEELWKEREMLRQDVLNFQGQKKELDPWKSLQLPLNELHQAKTMKMRLGTIRGMHRDALMKELEKLNFAYAQVLTSGKSLLNLSIVYLNEESEEVEEVLKKYGFTEVELDGQKTVKEEMQIIDEEISIKQQRISEIHNELIEASKFLSEMELRYEYLRNEESRKKAKEKILQSEHVDIFKGYVPTDRKEALEELLQFNFGSEYYWESHEAKKDDPQVPTMLKNDKFSEQFIDLTYLYAVPKYNEIDPTPFLAPFYWIFFGMMAGDLGYGLILLGLTIFLLKSKSIFPNNKRFVKFLFLLSFSVMIWGVLYGSFFGGLIKIPAVFDTSRDITQLLILSLLFGFIQLFAGLGIQAYMKIRDGHWKDAIYDVFFWYMAIGGGILLLVSGMAKFSNTMKLISKIIMITGMIGIVLTGGRDGKSIFSKLVGGLYSLYNISGYIGDFVSYTRLMALGLAGGFIGLAVNMIVGMMWNSTVGKIVGIIVFVVFHAFNIFLSVLSAYVHTARLTYVEYFGKFYEGGGEAFEPFQSSPKYIRIKD